MHLVDTEKGQSKKLVKHREKGQSKKFVKHNVMTKNKAVPRLTDLPERRHFVARTLTRFNHLRLFLVGVSKD